MGARSNRSSHVVRRLLVVVLAFGAIGLTSSTATAATEPSPDLSASVVGGHPVANTDFPALAAIMVEDPNLPARDRLVCTGTVITRRWVLTAGHCSAVLLFGPPIQVQIGNPSLGAAGAITVRVKTRVMYVLIYLTADQFVEGNETFNVTLSSPVNLTIGDGTGTVTIVNDD